LSKELLFAFFENENLLKCFVDKTFMCGHDDKQMISGWVSEHLIL